MRGITVLAIILLLTINASLPIVEGKAIERPIQRDVFLHEYFSQILTRFEDSLRYALINESYAFTLANNTFQELELLREEILYYSEKGVNSTVMQVFPPFYEFSKELILLNQLLTQFRAHEDPSLAAGILGTVDRMEGILDTIDNITLRNGPDILFFDTSGVRKALNDIKNYVSKYLQTKELMIGVSKSNPIINETITIFGTCPINETVTIVITNGNFTATLLVNPSGNFFSTQYRFENLGIYEIYAVQGGNKSNIVNVTVQKIPTIFVVDNTYFAFINNTIELRGRLVDYYGEPLAGRNISISNEMIVTGPKGEFNKTYSSEKATTLKVILTFEGDEIHKGTSKVVTLIFKKYPVSIKLQGPTEITLGGNATFTGIINPPLEVPLSVYINGSLAFNITSSNGAFSFTITPENTGSMEIYVEFPGNDYYERATSNAIVLNVVVPENMFLRYLVIGLLVVVLGAAVIVMGKKYAIRKRPKPTPKRSEVSYKPSLGEEYIPNEKLIYVTGDVAEAYKLLRMKLKDVFGIRESMTPREALKALKEWELYPILERITLIHEKAVYGGIELREDEIREFREGVERILIESTLGVISFEQGR